MRLPQILWKYILFIHSWICNQQEAWPHQTLFWDTEKKIMGENIENYSLILITTTTMMTIIEIMSWQPHYLRASRSHPTEEGTVSPIILCSTSHDNSTHTGFSPDRPETDSQCEKEQGKWLVSHPHTHPHTFMSVRRIKKNKTVIMPKAQPVKYVGYAIWTNLSRVGCNQPTPHAITSGFMISPPARPWKLLIWSQCPPPEASLSTYSIKCRPRTDQLIFLDFSSNHFTTFS